MDLKLLIQTTIYCFIVILGFLIAIPVAITTSNFSGLCLMYATLRDDSTSSNRREIVPGPLSNCHYVTYLHVVTSVLYPFLMALLHIVTIMKQARGGNFGLLQAYYGNLTIFVVNTVVTVLSLIAACIISVGFSCWCGYLIDHFKIPTCADGQDDRWINWQGVNGSSFHTCYSLAMTACWLVFLCWLVQTGLNVLTYLRPRHRGKGIPSIGSPSNQSSGGS